MSNNKNNNSIPVSGEKPNPVVYLSVFVPKFLQCRNCGNALASKELNVFDNPDQCIHFLEQLHDKNFPLCLSRSLILLWGLGAVATREKRIH